MTGIAAILRDLAGRHKAQLRQGIRVSVAALASYALARLLQVPLPLWVVLTTLIVSQMSVGGSLKATFDYLGGTLSGAVYGATIAALVPHSGELALVAVMAVAVAPLAFLAATNSSFRAAPVTAVIVLVGPTTAQDGPITSAAERVIEVALGGITALAVSLIVLPARAHVLAIQAAARMLERIAAMLPDLFAGFSRSRDPATIFDMQTVIGRAFAQLDTIGAEAHRERQALDFGKPDLGPLVRTLLRLRHDLVMVGRAAQVPLPEVLRPRLVPRLAEFTAAAADYLRACAAALTAAAHPPPLAATEAALASYAAEIAAIRRDGVMREMPLEVVERIFALGFALDELRRNFADLARCVNECAASEPAAG